jgi:hypothetical protein
MNRSSIGTRVTGCAPPAVRSPITVARPSRCSENAIHSAAEKDVDPVSTTTGISPERWPGTAARLHWLRSTRAPSFSVVVVEEFLVLARRVEVAHQELRHLQDAAVVVAQVDDEALGAFGEPHGPCRCLLGVLRIGEEIEPDIGQAPVESSSVAKAEIGRPLAIALRLGRRLAFAFARRPAATSSGSKATEKCRSSLALTSPRARLAANCALRSARIEPACPTRRKWRGCGPERRSSASAPPRGAKRLPAAPPDPGSARRPLLALGPRQPTAKEKLEKPLSTPLCNMLRNILHKGSSSIFLPNLHASQRMKRSRS